MIQFLHAQHEVDKQTHNKQNKNFKQTRELIVQIKSGKQTIITKDKKNRFCYEVKTENRSIISYCMLKTKNNYQKGEKMKKMRECFKEITELEYGRTRTSKGG